MKKIGLFIGLIMLLTQCKFSEESASMVIPEAEITKLKPNLRYGIDLDRYDPEEKTIARNDTFGDILYDLGFNYADAFDIITAIDDDVKINSLRYGKPYTIFYTKDSLRLPEYFVYHPNVESYTRIKLRDSLYGKTITKPIQTYVMQASGIIENSLYQSMLNNGLSEILAYYLSDVYAWTIDFTRLQKGDRFKVIYTEKFVDDSLSIGIENIKAAYFEHQGNPIYAFEFESDAEKGIQDYFDQNAKNLRRAFLKAPVQFSRISSRYNLRRRIAYYGYKIRPHLGTDYAAPIGTPILATANGTVVKSSYTRGNGNYVTLKHNATYSTQYLHMQRRKVKVGQFVKQGDVIGWIGMTGNTSGPHVCYRFWKNGRQVDPFKQKLPEAEPLSDSLKVRYFNQIMPLKYDLDCILFENETPQSITKLSNLNANIDGITQKKSFGP